MKNMKGPCAPSAHGYALLITVKLKLAIASKYEANSLQERKGNANQSTVHWVLVNMHL